MCVIFIAEHQRPSEEDVRAAWEVNPHGAGIAWREERKRGKEISSVVKWEKGLSLEEIVRKVAETPLPFIAHFRVASVGGTSRWLTHPFEVAEGAELRLKGETTNFVLFHNGHWNAWDVALKESLRAAAGKLKLPTGKWSDSRAMSWLASAYGQGYLELLDHKIVCFGPEAEDLEIFGGPWSIHGPADDAPKFMASNSYWVDKSRKYRRNSSKSQNDSKEEVSSEQKQDPSDSYHAQAPASIFPGIRTGGYTSKKQRGGPQKGHGGASAEDPFQKRPSPAELEKHGWPKDIPNAYRRGETSWAVVVAAKLLGLISLKTFRKLEGTRKRKGVELETAFRLYQEREKAANLRRAEEFLNGNLPMN